ncbi:MAG: adenylate/guanylate cyclase domain-containing protein [Planctomycetes bacterium]|nr:adenylate/guanylate cyclase domain-containing protein [Planctomycetota bacterium]
MLRRVQTQHTRRPASTSDSRADTLERLALLFGNNWDSRGATLADSALDGEMSATSMPLTVNIYLRKQQVCSVELTSQLELGRQRPNEPAPYAQIGDRLTIAQLEESDVSRRHLHLESLPGGRLRIKNLSQVNPVVLGTDDQIKPGEHRDVTPPTLLSLGDRVIQIEPTREVQPLGALDSFVHQTMPPGGPDTDSALLSGILTGRRSNEETEYLLRGLHATIGLFQLASNASEFFSMATQAMIDIVGMETAAVIIWQGREWRAESYCSRSRDAAEEETWEPSSTILERVRSERKTFWRVPTEDASASLMDVKSLVAAPILNRRAEVVGAIYGDRRRRKDGRLDLQITEVDAILVELLSTSVAAGLARLEQEKAALEARVLFEQFFTPELSRQLEAQPDLLLGKDSEVSLLFCDLRGFSDVSEQLGARLTIDWIHDVMETLSTCVSEQNGVLVDTLGDRLIGMWGAPIDRDDHANLACRASICMIEQLPALNRRWQNALSKPLDLGIGVHTGTARVGNIGSTRKFKYGPLGSSVRLAARIEEATRNWATKVLISEATAEQLDETFSTRRLGPLGDQALPTQLYELAADPPDDWPETKRRYETALDAYERGDLPTATRMLAKLLADRPTDRPALQMLARINDSSMGHMR